MNKVVNVTVNVNANESDEIVVVGFDSAGIIRAVTKTIKEFAKEMAKQLRLYYPSVKCMTEEQFVELQNKEMEERRRRIKFA